VCRSHAILPLTLVKNTPISSKTEKERQIWRLFEVQKDRFMGACYSAANWHCVGQTRGRGRNDRLNQRAAPLKSIWLYALCSVLES
jgi:Domain of unknown function (DUF4338)